MNYTSQIGQDKFALEKMGFKRDGTFVEVGCHDPIVMSNTYVMDKVYNWRGIGIDIDGSFAKRWKDIRPRTKFVIQDASTIDWVKLFEENNMPETIDYLSLDVDPCTQTYAILKTIPFNKYNFNVITFETDYFRYHNKEVRDGSRAFLKDYGYVFQQEVSQQDDFYVHANIITI